jgi:hypothetical protein
MPAAMIMCRILSEVLKVSSVPRQIRGEQKVQLFELSVLFMPPAVVLPLMHN